MKKSIKLSLFSVLAGGYGLLNPTNVLAACSPVVKNGVDITCDGNINTPQSFTDASRITATINACTQIDVTAQRSKKMPKRRTHARIQEQLKAINPVLANPAEFRASLKR